MEAYIILTTTSSKKEAKFIAKALLEHNLIACAQWSKIKSLYRFKGQIHCDKEYLLRLKTTKSALEKARSMLLSLHSYETPQFLALAIDEISHEYAAFIYANTRQTHIV